MKKLLIFIAFLGLMSANPNPLYAKVIDFDIYKLDANPFSNDPVLLVMSGIQGDEPGAFNATSILIKHYKITRGSLWVVPNLNQHSILKNNRGIYGDMNRKFAYLSPNDPEYGTIQKIKALILDERVEKILHLHDGSGFYRETYINAMLNQNRWGNCSIIDQDTLFTNGDLNYNITQMIDYINENLLDEIHRYRIRNTHTAQGDDEQIKSLTYFATLNKKMAFASEASKSLPLKKRVYYHLLAIEGMLQNMGIEFERDFELSVEQIGEMLHYKSANIVMEGIVELPLYNIKPTLNYFPLPKGQVAFQSNTPIVWLFKDGGIYRIKNGNRPIATLKPFYIDFDNSLERVDLIVDGAEVSAKIGSVVKVKNSFSVKNLPYRVNIIGYSGSGSEVGVELKRRDLMGKFAIDKANTKFRVEFYKGESGDLGESNNFGRESSESGRDSSNSSKSNGDSVDFSADSPKDSKRKNSSNSKQKAKEKFSGMIIVDFDNETATK